MKPINKILVPTDFSAPAINALHYALVLAKVTAAEVHLVHAYNVPVIDPYMPGETINGMMEEVKAAAEKSMRDLLDNFYGETIHTHVIMGFAVDEIVNFADDHVVDLIVMGTSGASGMEGVLFGSNTSGVIGKSNQMVIAVPNEYSIRLKPDNIIYASDFTSNEEVVFRLLCILAETYNSRLHLLHIKGGDPSLLGRPAQEIYEELAASVPAQQITFAEREDIDVVHGIQEYVSHHSCDLLVMAMHKRTLFERFFHRSKTKAMAHHTEIPLLVLKKLD